MNHHCSLFVSAVYISIFFRVGIKRFSLFKWSNHGLYGYNESVPSHDEIPQVVHRVHNSYAVLRVHLTDIISTTEPVLLIEIVIYNSTPATLAYMSVWCVHILFMVTFKVDVNDYWLGISKGKQTHTLHLGGSYTEYCIEKHGVKLTPWLFPHSNHPTPALGKTFIHIVLKKSLIINKVLLVVFPTTCIVLIALSRCASMK